MEAVHTSFHARHPGWAWIARGTAQGRSSKPRLSASTSAAPRSVFGSAVWRKCPGRSCSAPRSDPADRTVQVARPCSPHIPLQTKGITGTPTALPFFEASDGRGDDVQNPGVPGAVCSVGRAGRISGSATGCRSCGSSGWASEFRRLIWPEGRTAPVSRRNCRILPPYQPKSRVQPPKNAAFPPIRPFHRSQPALKAGLSGCSSGRGRVITQGLGR